MARINAEILTFNRGRLSRLALARTDLDRTRLSAQIQTNFIPRTLGSMMLRPGFEHMGQIRNNSSCVFVPFVFNNRDKALLELTTTAMRVWVSDAVIQRTGVSSSFVNGTFTGSTIGQWTDADDVGSSSLYVTGDFMGLAGTRYAYARRRQTVAVGAADANKEHGINLNINRGRVTMIIGSSSGGSDYLNAESLRPGQYSFAVTPSSEMYVELSANTEYLSRVASVSIDSSGDLVIDTPWSSTDLEHIRTSQSADVIFASCKDIKQRRIERWQTRGWAVVEYDAQDGPYRNPNVAEIRLTPSALSGDITLSADGAVFSTGNVGSLYRITSIGQKVQATVTGADQWTDPIRVSGVGNTRTFNIFVLGGIGTSVATVTVQRSDGEVGSWADVSGLSYTSSAAPQHTDGLDNQISFYRIGVGTTGWTGSTSDSAVVSLIYSGGGLDGVAKVTNVISSTESSAIVLKTLGSTSASETWQEGDWSERRGYPSATMLHEGRLWWAGKAKLWGSISDGFESFDPDTEGDSGPINRSLGEGAVDQIPWLQSLGRLVVGAEGREIQAKTNSLEEPISPTNFSPRDVSNQGSTGVQAVKIDRRALYVQRGGTRLYELRPPGSAADTYDYASIDRTVLVPEIGEPGIARLGVQRQPDTRVHAVRPDGTVGMLVSDPAEDVSCWIDVKSTGANGCIEEVVTLPGNVEDDVYYVVKREINGSTVRHLEKWATEFHARGGSSNRMADAFASFNSSNGSTSVTGATHLIAATVVAWGSGSTAGSSTSGVFLGSTFVVDSGGNFDIPSTLARASTTVCYGLSYEGMFKSVKLAYGAQRGSPLTQRKKVDHIGLIVADTHIKGLTFSYTTSSAVTFDEMPMQSKGAPMSTNKVYDEFDEQAIPFPGNWDTDSRIVLKGVAPKPVTALGLIVAMETSEK